MSGGNSMAEAVKQYLEDRRQLGYEMTAPATELMRFARYADARHHVGPLTQELIFGWAREHVLRTSAVTAARRLEIVRPFAAYYRQFEPATEIPPPGTLGRGHRRLVPHIYTDQELVQLLQASERLTPYTGLRPLTYRTLFGLIAAAGLRLSEAVNLTVSDVDLDAGTVTIRETKFRKSRCLPVHSSVIQALGRYRGIPRPQSRVRRYSAVLRVTVGLRSAQEDGRERVPAHAAASGLGGPRRLPDPTDPRHASHVCREAPAAMARRRPVDRSGNVLAVHLPRPRQDL